jgi:hypothetical protein
MKPPEDKIYQIIAKSDGVETCNQFHRDLYIAIRNLLAHIQVDAVELLVDQGEDDQTIGEVMMSVQVPFMLVKNMEVGEIIHNKLADDIGYWLICHKLI